MSKSLYFGCYNNCPDITIEWGNTWFHELYPKDLWFLYNRITLKKSWPRTLCTETNTAIARIFHDFHYASPERTSLVVGSTCHRSRLFQVFSTQLSWRLAIVITGLFQANSTDPTICIPLPPTIVPFYISTGESCCYCVSTTMYGKFKTSFNSITKMKWVRNTGS